MHFWFSPLCYHLKYLSALSRKYTANLKEPCELCKDITTQKIFTFVFVAACSSYCMVSGRDISHHLEPCRLLHETLGLCLCLHFTSHPEMGFLWWEEWCWCFRAHKFTDTVRTVTSLWFTSWCFKSLEWPCHSLHWKHSITLIFYHFFLLILIQPLLFLSLPSSVNT